MHQVAYVCMYIYIALVEYVHLVRREVTGYRGRSTLIDFCYANDVSELRTALKEMCEGG